MELKLPYAPDSSGEDSSVPTSPGLGDTDSLLHSVAGRLDELDSLALLDSGANVERWDKSTLSWQPLRSMTSSASASLGDAELDEVSFFADIEDISVVTLPVSSVESVLPDRASSTNEPAVPANNTGTPWSSTGIRQTIFYALKMLCNGETLSSRLLIILLTMLSLVRPSNDGTLLTPPSTPVDYVELVSSTPAVDVASLPTPDLYPVADESLPSATTYFFLSIIGLYAIFRIARRTSALPSPPSPARNRRARPATPAVQRRQPAAPRATRVTRASVEVKPESREVTFEEEEDDDPQVLTTEQVFNVCLLGGEKVGISSLLARQLFGDKVDCLTQHVDESYRQAYKKKGAPTVTLELCDWHIEKTRKQVGSRGLHVAVVVFALDDQASLAEAQQTVKQVKAAGKETGRLKAVYLVANKSDLAEQAGPAANVRLAATRRRAEAFAQEHDVSLCETSAKTGEGVRDLFRTIARRLRAA